MIFYGPGKGVLHSLEVFGIELRSTGIGDVKAYRKCTHSLYSMHVLRHQREATLTTTFLCHQFRPTTAAGQVQVGKSELEIHVSS